MIDGVIITELKRIGDDRGEIRHALRNTDVTFDGFGEAYFSAVKNGVVKGWKKHRQMLSNLIVVEGVIRFVLVDDRPNSPTAGQFMDITHSLEKYSRLTVPPGLWMAFQGIGKDDNLLLNIASIPHDPTESENILLDSPNLTRAGIPLINWGKSHE